MSAYEINIQNWRMGDYADFFEAVEANHLKELFRLVAKVVQAWPFSGDPSKPESYRDLEPEQWQATTKAVMEAVNNRFTKGN